MNIGEEEEAIELPIPVDPATIPIEQPVKSAPVEQPIPAHAMAEAPAYAKMRVKVLHDK